MLLFTRADRLYTRWSPSLLMATGDSHRWIAQGNDNALKEGTFPLAPTAMPHVGRPMLGRDCSDATTGSYQCTTLKCLSTMKLPAENRCTGRGLQQGRSRVGHRGRQGWKHGGTGGYGAGQCTVTALVSTVCHAPLAWNSGPMFFSVSGVVKWELER